MIRITDEKNCCGCGACVATCPVECISVKEGTLGATFPCVNEEMCINCQMCENVCPILNAESPKNTQTYTQALYIGYSKEDSIRFKSSSGGMFYTFAAALISEGYQIFGSSFDDNLKLKCTSTNTLEGLNKLCKSKYIQSDITSKYLEIKERLENSQKIMIVSTPCQIAALKLFLGKNYENLLTVDFFCHGVPSQRFFDECIAYENKTNKFQVINYEFRSKVKDAVTPHYFTQTILKEGREYRKTRFYFESPFYAFFQQYVSLRESCYSCKFSSQNRVSDITIGDFHVADQYIEGIDRFKGVSSVIINTSKGSVLLEKVKKSLNLFGFDLGKMIDNKVFFSGCTNRPNHRNEFIGTYEKFGIDGLCKKYFGWRRYYRQKIYYRMPFRIRKIMRKVFSID